MSETVKTDICVIGGGSGGLSVAAGAAQMGADVVLVEGGKMGGDCLNYGCVPSKALLAAAAHAHHGDVASFGLTGGQKRVSFSKVMAHVRDVIAGIAPMDSVERFSQLGVRVIEAYGRFTGPRTLAAGDVTIQAKRFVIATGSSALLPPVRGLDKTPYLTNETVFDLTAQPEHLLVIGGGPIGMELAQAFNRLGSEVSVIEAGTCLGREDPEISRFVTDRLAAEGVQIHAKTQIRSVSYAPRSRKAKVTIETTRGKISGSHVLVATGRRANIDRLELDKAGVELTGADHAPHIKTDARLRTTNKRIFAIGDVRGGPQFTHAAGYDAGIVIRNILFFLPAKADYRALPRVTYTAPELAQVGLTEAEARQQFSDVKCLRWPFAENDRARAERDETGMVKIVTSGSGRILGASIVGKNAGDLLAPWTLALTQGLSISAMASTVAPYPTRGEAGKRAAGDYYTPSLFSHRTRKIVRALAALRW
jgi:pyruvate/2-oxoglutarate dehydrogenase complex dihydrolipoamide dehydrogenase (E3) component